MLLLLALTLSDATLPLQAELRFVSSFVRSYVGKTVRICGDAEQSQTLGTRYLVKRSGDPMMGETVYSILVDKSVTQFKVGKDVCLVGQVRRTDGLSHDEAKARGALVGPIDGLNTYYALYGVDKVGH